jgi:hypothetical protein
VHLVGLSIENINYQDVRNHEYQIKNSFTAYRVHLLRLVTHSDYFLYTIKLVVIIIEEQVVYYVVRTDSLNVSQIHVRLERVKMLVMFVCVGRDSSVGIATRYGLDGPRIESRWGRDFSQPPRQALGPTQPPVQWVPGIFRGKVAGPWH